MEFGHPVYLDINKAAAHVDQLCEIHTQALVYKSFSVLLFNFLECPAVFVKLLSIDVSLNEEELISFSNLYLDFLYYLPLPDMNSGNRDNLVSPQDYLSLPDDTLILLYDLSNFLCFIDQLKKIIQHLEDVKIISILPTILVNFYDIDINVYINRIDGLQKEPNLIQSLKKYNAEIIRVDQLIHLQLNIILNTNEG